jgi:hypothetical protein
MSSAKDLIRNILRNIVHHVHDLHGPESSWPPKKMIKPPLSARGGQNDDFRPLTFRPGGGGHGVQGQICDILTPASYESLPAPSGHADSHTLDTYIWGWGEGGSDIRSMSRIRPIASVECRCPLVFSNRRQDDCLHLLPLGVTMSRSPYL